MTRALCSPPSGARRWKLWTCFLLLVLLAGTGPLTPATAQRSLEIRSFNTTIEVREDASVRVFESIQVRFNGSWNGLYRTIPVKYESPQGFSFRLFLDLESVTDESGQRLRTELEQEGAYRKLKIWVPGAQDVTRTLTIRYTIPNALKFFENHDELYWNATGTEWDVPIQAASAVVRLPAGVSGLRATAFTGAYGSSASDARIEQLEDGFYFETTRPLNFREGLTVVVGWDHGVVHRPGIMRRASFFMRANWLLFLPLLSLLAMFWIWRRWGRDPERRSIAPAYEPPEGLTPAEVGTLVDNTPDPRDITATLVDLAVRGFIRIEELEKKGFLKVFKDTDYRFHRVRESADWAPLAAHERHFLEGLFGSNGVAKEVDLSDLKNEFYKTLSTIRDDLLTGLKVAGYYRHRPDRVLGAFVVVGVAVLGLAIPGFQGLAEVFMTSNASALLAAILFAAPVVGFGIVMPARTERGTRALEGILGFQEFLDRVESDRFKRMITSPEMFEKYLPFAMALGVEERWAKAFQDIYTDPPQWYVGHHPHAAFRTGLFVSSLNSMTSQATTVMASQPRSTGGSGFSGGGFGGGGGFSGGGFGGGGGGGF